MQQFAKVLPNDLEARKAFVQSGSLQKLQEAEWGLGLALDFGREGLQDGVGRAGAVSNTTSLRDVWWKGIHNLHFPQTLVASFMLDV